MKEKVTLNRKEQKRLMKKRCPDIIRAGGLGVSPTPKFGDIGG
jgi:hypothetical protein